MQDLVKKTVVITVTAIATVAVVGSLGFVGYRAYVKHKFEEENAGLLGVCASYRVVTAAHATYWMKLANDSPSDFQFYTKGWTHDADMRAYSEAGCLELFPADREKAAYEAGEKVAEYAMANRKYIARDYVEGYANKLAPGWRNP